MKGSQRPSTVGDGATDGIVRRQSTPKQPEIHPLTAATGFKRLGFALLAAIAVGAGVLLAAGYLISADAVRQQVLSEIRAVTGLNPILRGEATRLAVSLRQRQLRRRGAGRRQAAGAHRRAADRAPALFSAAARPGRDRRRGAGAADHRDRPGAERQIQLVRPDRGAGAQPDQGRAARVAAFSEMRIDNGTVVVRSDGTQGRRDADRRGIFAGLAVDLQELRRHRPLRLA